MVLCRKKKKKSYFRSFFVYNFFILIELFEFYLLVSFTIYNKKNLKKYDWLYMKRKIVKSFKMYFSL